MDTTALLSGLIRIPSFSREEDAACTFLQEWLEGEGFPVRRTDNNLWMASGPPDGRPTLLLIPDSERGMGGLVGEYLYVMALEGL